jgi:hypothetical protein
MCASNECLDKSGKVVTAAVQLRKEYAVDDCMHRVALQLAQRKRLCSTHCSMQGSRHTNTATST